MISFDEAVQAAHSIYIQAFDATYESFMPGHFAGPSGLTLIVSEEKAIHGFGIMNGLTPTAQILSAISDWNQRNMVGHFWLAEGADNDNWSLVCGFKYLLEWETTETWITKVSQLCGAYPTLLSTFLARAEDFSGRPYWESMVNSSSDTSIGAAALVLLGHLG